MSGTRHLLHGVSCYNESKAFNGYTIFAPLGGCFVWLIDMQGRIVHYWKTPTKPGEHGVLLPDGNLLFLGRSEDHQGPERHLGGYGGKLFELDWSGNPVWRYENVYMHHDCWRKQNGNTLILRWFDMIPEEISSRIRGGLPMEGPAAKKFGTGAKMWANGIEEIAPNGEVVWEWKDYEHLDPDSNRINPLDWRNEWTHLNCIEERDDKILITARQTSNIYIIDKATGTVEWQWGYGEVSHQHNATFLENGNILCLDNGLGRFNTELSYSRIIEVNPRTNKIEWEYKANPPSEFYTGVMGSCQRLPNGNTLIAETTHGRVFEVTNDGEIVWEMVNPFYGDFVCTGWNNMVFRAYRYGIDYEGLKGKVLNPNKYRKISRAYGMTEAHSRDLDESPHVRSKRERMLLSGVISNTASKCYIGYTLFSPIGAPKSVLIDMKGNILNEWHLRQPAALQTELLPGGNLLCSGHVSEGKMAEFAGAGGEIYELDWKGKLIWKYEDDHLHHTFYPMSNGNVMVVKWVQVPENVAMKVSGGIPGSEPDGIMYCDALEEIDKSGNVVWQWLAFEHLDPKIDSICPVCSRSEWTGINRCEVLPDGNVLVCFSRTHMIGIISKKLGSVVWRWGSTELGHPHHPTLSNGGNILLLDNGRHCNGLNIGYSRIIEVDPTTNAIVWEYMSSPWCDFYSSTMGNCQILGNFSDPAGLEKESRGNILICEGVHGRIFEITCRGETVWEYISPFFYDTPQFGHTNMMFSAYRYGPNLEKAWIAPTRHVPKQQSAMTNDTRVHSRLERLGY